MINHFLLRIFNSTKMCFLFSELTFAFKSLDATPSLTKRIISLPFRSLSSLYSSEYPSIQNCTCGKDESSFVSDNSNMSMLSLTMVAKSSNIFCKELILRWLIISLSGFLFLRFRKVPGSNKIWSFLHAEISQIRFYRGW